MEEYQVSVYTPPGPTVEEFQVSVYTTPGPTAGTYSDLWLTLIGSEGETLPVSLSRAKQHLLPGSMCVVTVRSEGAVGPVVLVRLRLEAPRGFPDQAWHCGQVGVRRLCEGPREGPGVCQDQEHEEVFPGGRWLRSADGDVELRNGTLCLFNSEVEQKLRDHRLKELQNNQRHIGWRLYTEGAPECVDMTLSELGPNLTYTRQSPGINVHCLKGFAENAESWSTFTELETLFTHNGRLNTIAKYVQAHWKEDWFFGYQCLNGCNPLMVCQTHILPPKLSVTSDMLRPFLPETSSLEQELEKGTIFLLDYEVLEGLPANVINGKQQYLSAPLCLLHLDQHGQLKPIAIQLQQVPAGPQNPVFLPSDSTCDWLLAKIWVRSADFHCHQLISHFLKTHLLGEVCCTATLRQLPEIHPLFQLLMPHIRTSLQINIEARASLLAPNGVFDKATACGLEALPVLLSRATSRLRYRSLCVPDDLTDRGLHVLPNCYYAQDALRVWDALHRFVLGWVELYYHGDLDVEQDSEVQSWIREIYTHGFQQQPQSGCPQSFQNKPELCKFVTMVIFSCSALHAAVNFSQLDFNLWMPNSPASMSRPPPQSKGSVTEDEILSFLPDINSTCGVLTTLSLLSMPAADYVPLCQYRGFVFSSGAPRRLVEEVQAELRAISDDITDRNRKLELPYPYLSPDRIENSVAI